MSWADKFISPSRVDTFAQFLTGELYSFGDRPEFSTEMFIDKLLKLETFSPKAECGTAIHKALEESTYGILPETFTVNGWTVVIPETIDFELAIPQIREVWVQGCIVDVNVVGRVDSINAIAVHDIKTTSKYDPEKYIDSYQWKMYCLMTGLDKFVYDVITVKVDEVFKSVEITGYEKLELYTYPTMQAEVESIVTEYKAMLLRLEPLIVNRVNEYNKDITNLINFIDNAKSWAINSLDILDNTIKQLKEKKIILKGINDGN